MLFRILSKESGVIARDCMKVIYYIIHNNVVTLKLLSQCLLLGDDLRCSIVPEPNHALHQP